MSFVNTIYVSKTDPDSISRMVGELNNQDNYYSDGRYTNFGPDILCKDCNNAHCTYNPIALGMRTPIAVVCNVCKFVYFHSDDVKK